MTPDERWRKESRPYSGTVTLLLWFIGLAGAFALFTISAVQQAIGNDLIPLIKAILTGSVSYLEMTQFFTHLFILIFGIFWGINGYREINNLQDWLKPPKVLSDSRYQFYVFAVFIGMFLGCLFAISSRLQILVTVFGLYSAADLFLWKIRQTEIAKLVNGNETTIRHDMKSIEGEPVHKRGKTARNMEIFVKANVVLKEFYLEKPHKIRIFTQLLIMIVLAILIEMTSVTTNPPRWVELAGYGVFLSCAICCEYVIHRWRRQMENDLAKLDQKLSMSS